MSDTTQHQKPERKIIKTDVSNMELSEYYQSIDELIDFLQTARESGATTCEIGAYIPWGEGRAESFEISTYYNRDETDDELEKRKNVGFWGAMSCIANVGVIYCVNISPNTELDTTKLLSNE